MSRKTMALCAMREKRFTSLQNGGPPHSKTVDPKKKKKKPVLIVSVKVMRETNATDNASLTLHFTLITQLLLITQ